jgi:hypothetical protein
VTIAPTNGRRQDVGRERTALDATDGTSSVIGSERVALENDDPSVLGGPVDRLTLSAPT